ncbi:hypothetical protein C9397_03700, partial [Xanthomonas vasicola pv. vasculorum]
RANILISTCSSTVSMALQKGQRLREVGQFEVAEVGQIKSAGDRARFRTTVRINERTTGIQ